MTFLAPALLGFLILIPVVILIYLIRAQRRRAPVSSVLLWRNMVRDLEMRTRLRRPPLTVLLLLQLLAILLGALALGRPFWETATPPARQLVLVLDASASMNATDVSPSRLAVAKQRARELIASAPAGSAFAVVRAGPQARVVATTREVAAAQAAVEAVEPSDGASDLRTAWLVAGALAAARPQVPTDVVLLSDGAFPDPLPAIPATIRFVPVGERSENQAIVQLGIRPPLAGGTRTTAFVRLANFAATPVERRVRVVADGIVVDEQIARLRERGTLDLTVEAPAGTRVLAVQLVGSDLLAADDRAQALVPLPGEREVLLVSAAPEVMRRALRAIPQLTVREAAPAQYREPGGAALVVFDGFLPPTLPAVPVLIVNPPVGSWLVPARIGHPAFALGVDPESALVTGVDFTAVEFGRVAQLAVPSWAAPVVTGPDGPLVLEGEREGRRVVIFGFDPSASTLPKLVAFPALVANAVEWLINGPEGASPVGTTVRLPAGLSGELVGPDGRSHPLGPFAAATDRAGLYRLRRPGADPLPLFALNLTNEVESDLTPRTPQFSQLFPPVSLPSPEDRPVGIEFWPWLTGGVLVVLLVEWWFFTRRRAT